jgi:hypothetical protein
MGGITDAGRAVARRVLPANAYSFSRAVWQSTRRVGGEIRIFLSAGGFPKVLLHVGAAPGDDLVCTAVARELRKRGIGPTWMISNYPEMFAGTGDVRMVLPTSIDGEAFGKFWSLDYRYLACPPVVSNDRSEPPARHLIAEQCVRAGITGKIDLRPYIRLCDEERASGAWAAGRIAIQSSGLGSKYPMRNKQWYPERFQAVVYALRRKYDFVQLGSDSDPPLDCVTDLRGRTDIRQVAALLYHAALYVGNAGFLMHVARAVECPSVIVYGGREAPWQTGYPCNTNLHTALSCAPCWRWNSCDYDRKCMDSITAAAVVQEVRQTLAKPRGLLRIDTTEI